MPSPTPCPFNPQKPPRVAIWGIGHSGGASMMAGNDPRLSAVILVMPFTSGKRDESAFPPGTLDRAWQNRFETAQAWSSSNPKVEYVTLWAESEANAQGEGPQRFPTGFPPYNFITEAKQRSDNAGTPWENKITLQSFWHIANIEPVDYISKIAPTPFLYLAANTDALTGPVERHRKTFELAGEPKEFAVLKNHHLATYFGKDFDENVGIQIVFLKKHLL